MIQRVLLFLVLNFLALALGVYFTGDGVPSLWYQELDKAPWTPPGWVFGAAWTFIMISFAFYMAFWMQKTKTALKTIIGIYGIQWVLNIAWNPVFFFGHQVGLGLVVISALTIWVTYMLFGYRKETKMRALFLMPYWIWLLIATSLNAYIFLNN